MKKFKSFINKNNTVNSIVDGAAINDGGDDGSHLTQSFNSNSMRYFQMAQSFYICLFAYLFLFLLL